MSSPLYYTPLRYPGGKTKIAEYIKLVFKENELMDGVHVEPYAGGAGVAMELLLLGYASHIYINDIDPGIYAFWNCVLNHTDLLCNKIYKAKLDIATWERQRLIQKEVVDPMSIELGFSTFYLNRTNYSGVINGGPIGGFQQESKWNMAARFNREDLIKRIERIAYLNEKIHISNTDACAFIRNTVASLPKKTFVYIDPPYYKKGSCLYRNFYQPRDHVEVGSSVKKMKHPWIVSYDNVPEISEIYAGFRMLHYSLSYSIRAAKQGSECMFFSDCLVLPNIANPTKVK